MHHRLSAEGRARVSASRERKRVVRARACFALEFRSLGFHVVVIAVGAEKNISWQSLENAKHALVVCRDRKQFWTTQTQFWQWVREGIVIKTGEQPLTGLFRREHEELLVLLSNTVLNLAHPNHMREALLSRRVGMAGK